MSAPNARNAPGIASDSDSRDAVPPQLSAAEDFAEIARTLHAEDGTESTLLAVCRLAVDVIGGAEHAAVTVVRRGVFVTVAATDELPAQIDKLQYTTNQGPCLDAIREEPTFHTVDLDLETRWPDFAVQAVTNTGIHSMLAQRLFVDRDNLGALNLYARAPGAFSAADVATSAVFAAHAAIAYAAAQEHERAVNLETALLNSRDIGVALGIVMASRRINRDAAFDALRLASHRSGRKLAEVARDVGDTGTLDLA